jgi:hypothetical protein
MTMTRRLTTTTVALMLTALVAVPGADARKAPSCAQAKTKTIAQNSKLRVYQKGKGDTRSLYACRRSSGKRTKLAEAFDDGIETSASYGDVRLSGLFVAWSYTATDLSCKADCPPGYNPVTQLIGVFDASVRKSRSVAGYPVGHALVLSKDGGVAWAAQPTSAGPVEIRGSVREGDDRLFDSGSIDPKTLAIEITIISWTRDGEEHFARLR